MESGRSLEYIEKIVGEGDEPWETSRISRLGEWGDLLGMITLMARWDKEKPL